MAVKVKRERPDQRRHHRVTAPLFVDLGGHFVRASDWSLGGLRVEAFPGPLPEVGAEISFEITLPFQGFDVSFKVKGEVVRNAKADGMFAVRYTELGERERELMSHFIEELVRGSMVDVEDTIQRIDVPVTPASLEPDKPRISQLPPQRWPKKLIAMSAFYIVAGMVIFGYAGVLAYANFFRMEIQTAVVSAPVETVAAQADGHVAWTSYKPGDTVRTGDAILNLVDNQIERDIALADIAVKEKKAQLAYLKQRQLEELDKAQAYASVETKNVKQTRLELDSAAARVTAARRQLARLQSLKAKGFTTDVKLEEAEKQAITLQKDLESRRIELQTRIELAHHNVGKRLFTGSDVVGDVASVEAQVKLAEHEVDLARQRHQAYLASRDRIAVRAPFDGTILELPRLDRGSIRRGDVVAVIEQRRQRQVTAYVTQDEIQKIGLGDEALLFFPALNETLRGRVRQIDRTSGFIREQEQRQNPGYAWRGPTDRSAKVLIEFAHPEQVADTERYRSGLPVVVVFDQRSTNSLISSLQKKLSLVF